MDARERISDIVLDSTEIEFLYNELLKHCEQDSFYSIPYDRRSKVYINAKKKLKFEVTKELGTLNEESDAKLDTFYFNSETRIASMLSHLRNAFAHNRIYQLKNSEILLEDVEYLSIKKIKNGIKPKLTMLAKISSFAKLNDIIVAVKQCKRKKQTK